MDISKELQGRLRHAIANVSPSDMQQLFNFLRQETYNKIRGANTDEERLSIQIRVRIFDEIELGLKSLRNSA
jgi:hypothetical protein